MTSNRIRILPDGTRVYSNGTKYKPLPPEQRKYKVRKPIDPRAVMFANTWFLPLDLTSEEVRSMPETRPDTDAYDHASKLRRCRCEVCKRPEARRWKLKWREDQMRMASS